jgi:probable selenium-dependent hydroxylase accessory protein YqeC
MVEDWKMDTINLPYYNRKILGQDSLMDLITCDWNKSQVISAVGGGGKTSFVYTLAEECVRKGLKTIVTTTTHMRRPKYGLSSNINEIWNSLNRYGCAVAGVNPFRRRMCGVDENVYEWMCDQADVIVVEADGAKFLPVKAPDLSYEPVIPKNTTYTAVLAGMSAVGEAIGEVCFRLPQIQELLKIEDLSQLLTEKRLAQILVEGYDGVVKEQSKQNPCCYVLNQVDTNVLYEKAKQVASFYPQKEFIATSLHTGKMGKSPEEIFVEKFTH